MDTRCPPSETPRLYGRRDACPTPHRKSPKLLLAKWTTLRRFGGSYLDTMTIHNLFALLALGAPAQPGTTPNPQGEMFKLIGMVAIMGVMMYLIIIRPQRTR